MTEFSFACVSVSSSGGEYFEVLFVDSENSEDSYFLIQRQFESPDGGFLYVESHNRALCGHFRIRKAELGRNLFNLELGCEPAERIQIKFQANGTRYSQLRRVRGL